MPAQPLTLIQPGGEGGPSGGYTYNAAVLRAWERLGIPARTVRLPGRWPYPGESERARFAGALRGRDTALVDGLIGSACPDQIAAAAARGTRVVLLMHLPLPAEAGLTPAQADRLGRAERAALDHAAAVIATSRWAAADLRSRYGERTVHVATPGCDRGPVATGSDPPHLLVLGAIIPRKNHAVLVRALESVGDLAWSAEFVGPWLPSDTGLHPLRRVLDGSPVRDRIGLLGPLTGEALEQRWTRTDLLLLPSLTETYGLVVTEALARGIPSVVSAGTGAVEALAGLACGTDATDGMSSELAGATAEPTDPGEWVTVLRTWLTRPALRRTWRERALARRTNLREWSATARDLAAVMKELA